MIIKELLYEISVTLHGIKVLHQSCYSNSFEYNVHYIMSESLSDYCSKGNIKYCMLPYIDDNEPIDKISIVIGQNPSISKSHSIDGTNLNILKTLKTINNNTFYVMLNTFPIINSDGSNSVSNIYLAENINIVQSIIEIIASHSRNIEFIIATGCTLDCYIPFIEMIDSYAKEYNIPLKCFYYNEVEKAGIQYHLSQQSCNRKGRTDRTKFSLEPISIGYPIEEQFAPISIVKK